MLPHLILQPALSQLRQHLLYFGLPIHKLLRWHPAAPFGLPHSVMEDDTYNGYHIPAGTTVIASQWSINFDPETFPEPLEFRPERYLDNPGLPVGAFGFGRRACVGRHFAMDSLFISVARILWGFRIGRFKDGEDGSSVPVWSFVADGALLRPAPFKALFSVRDVERHRIIMKDWADIEKDAESYYNSIEAGFDDSVDDALLQENVVTGFTSHPPVAKLSSFLRLGIRSTRFNCQVWEAHSISAL